MTFGKHPLEPHAADQMKQIHIRLLKYCMSLTGSPWEAEDLAQDACVKALPVLTGRLAHDNPEAYVKRIAKTTWIDHVRRKRRADAGGEIGKRPGSRRDRYPVELEPALQVAVRELSPLQRTVLLLQDVLGYRARETARALRTTEGAVKAALHRARQTLEKCRTAEGEVVSAPTADSDAALVRAYAEAIREGDAERIVRLYLGESAAVSDAVADRASGRTSARMAGRSGWTGSSARMLGRPGVTGMPARTAGRTGWTRPFMRCAA